MIGPAVVSPETQGTSRFQVTEWWLYEIDMVAETTIERYMKLA